jgi:cell fate regulator YaaT (PSP1 superfamily)
MPHVVEIAFKGNRKEFFVWDGAEPPPVKSAVIVDADRGEDLGVVHSTGDLATLRNAKTGHGLGGGTPNQKARRLATDADVRQHTTARSDDDDARKRSIERVRANSLVMKVTDAEWQWDRKKLTLYFTAEKRVDFRTLVRELASMFRTRIELKQIGVRDEAKRLDGYGRCGRQYCSSSWLPELRPVNLGVAKDQRLSLNPSQISGACGRLMCCLRYEHEFYVTTRRRFPKEGKSLRTAKGEEKVIANDLFRERVTLRGDEGESRVVSLEELRAELDALGIPFPVPATGAAKRIAEEEDAIDEDAELLPAVAELVASAEPEEAALLFSPEKVEQPGRPAQATAPAPANGERGEGERRRGRRRGRRGGRRGRTGGDGSAPPSSGPSSPPPSPTN